MIQTFLKKDGCPDLLLIFGGWGTWPGLFAECPFPPGHDVLLCYDYRSMDFDRESIAGYGQVTLLAWSMGVWVASMVFDSKAVTDSPSWRCRVAVGGTMYPRDDSRGIPVAVFDGTLDNMSAPVLAKFRRRMCGRDLDVFMARMPERSPEDLKDELSALRSAVMSRMGNEPDFHWDKAVAGSRDMIFPLKSQLAAWSEAGVSVQEVDCAHYDSALFDSLISLI